MVKVTAASCALALALAAQKATAQSGSDILEFVDPLIGTANGGHVFAGATLPFGMAKAVADSVNDGQGGYAMKGGGAIKGFSHMYFILRPLRQRRQSLTGTHVLQARLWYWRCKFYAETTAIIQLVGRAAS